jgi:PAS domain S-box-containing protein
MSLTGDLSASEQALQLIEQVADIAFIITDAEGVITSCSAGAEQLTGWTRGEIVGQPAAVIFSPEDRAAGIPGKEMETARRNGAAADVRWLVARNGDRFLAECKLTPLRTPDGHIAGYANTLRDITSAGRLQESEAKFRAMVNATPHMVWSSLPDGTGDYFNERMTAFTGMPEERLYGHGWADLVHPDDRASAISAWMAALQKGESLSIEFRFRHVSGEYRWVLCRGEPVKDCAGNIIRWIGTNTDIHARKTAQARLAESEERFRILATTTAQVVWICDAKGEVVLDSASWRAFTGQTEARLRDLGWIDALHPDDRERTMEAWTRATRERSLYELECRVRHASGEYRWMLNRAVPLLDSDGSVREWVGTCTDVTDKKQTETALQETRRRLDATLVASEVGTFAWNIQSDQVFADASLMPLLGVTEQDIQGGRAEAYLKAIHPDDVNAVRKALEGVVTSGQTYQAVYRVVLAPHGEQRFVHARGKVEFSADGKPSWLTGIVIDVTALKAAEVELRQKEQQYRALFNSIEEGFYIVEMVFDESGRPVNHRYLEANASVARITGIQHAAGKLATDLIPEYDPAWRELFLNVLETGEPGQALVEVSRWGKWLDFSVTRLGERAENKLAVLVRDITERKRHEDALRFREERYRALFNSIDEGFYIIELIRDDAGKAVDYRFLEANPAAERHNGLRNPVGKRLSEVLPSPKLEWVARYDNVVRTGEPERFSDYSPSLGRWFDISVSRLGDASSRQTAILFNDVTERKHNEEKLHRLAADLRQANQRQNDFLATLAHELRNPLAPIRTGLDLIHAGMEVSPPVAKVHEMMDRQVNHLVYLIDDLLDLARVNSGKIVLKKSRSPLKEIVRHAIEASMPMINAKGHHLETEIVEEPIWVDADINRLRQVIGNLLTNAAKYTPHGGNIMLSLQRRDSEALISVSDNGIGIAAEDIPHLFDMFSQIGRGLGHAEGGLGIGLNLVKRLTEKHGGSVSVSSPGLNQGSTFTIRLPVAQRGTDGMAAETSQENMPAASASLRVLVVDDNIDAAQLLKELLAVNGHTVRLAHDGAEALEAARQFMPDLVLMDIGMPKMNGYEAASAMREEPGLQHAVLVAVTGLGMQADEARCLSAGFNHHLAKPVSLARLAELIAQVQ